MSHETSKATKRRFAEHDAGGFKWRDVFKGKGIDVGAGPDPLPFKRCVAFDKSNGDGDANSLSKYFALQSFDYIHASHVVEHLNDPKASLIDWLTVVKKGGYICFTVPDVGAYERFEYPSKFNPDHRASFSMIYRGSAFPVHIHIPTLCEQLASVAETLVARYVEANFNWKLGREVDQTWEPDRAVEIWNEVLLKRI